jgi:beta-lactamase regulating signal transducer with metallopeptidase domain
MRNLLLALLATQIALVPAFALSLWATPRRVGVRFAWGLHRALVVAVLVSPAVCLLPVRNLLPSPAAPPAPVRIAAAADQAAVTAAAIEAPFVIAVARVPRPIPAPAASVLAAALGMLSAGGVALLVARFGAQRLRERRIRRRGLVRRLGRLQVVASPLVTTPFSTGMLSPHVYLPSSLLDQRRELRMVLAHEGVHLRRAHYAWTIAEACLASLFWYNPLLVSQCARGRRVRELICDQVVGTRYAAEEYGGLLARAAERAVAMRSHPRFADGWIGRGALAERVSFLLHGGPRRSGPGARALAGAAGLFAGAFLLAAVPVLTPVSAGGAPEPRPETASSDPFPLESLMPLLSGDAYVSIDDYSRMKAGDPYNRISLDIRARATGAEVVAATTGRVIEVRRESSGAYTLTMRSDNGFGVLYGNLASAQVKGGDRVPAGAKIGTAGPSQAPDVTIVATASAKSPGASRLSHAYGSYSGEVTVLTGQLSDEPAYVDLASYSMFGYRNSTGTMTTSGYYTDDYNPTSECVLHFEVDTRGYFFDSVSFRPSPAATGAAANRFTQVIWVGDGK